MKSQFNESERQRLKLEEEVRNYETKITNIRQVVDELVSLVSAVGAKLNLTFLGDSKHRRMSCGEPTGRRNVTLPITSREP